MTARIVLVRHAEPARWARGRAIGRTDVGLSRAGTRSARGLAARLARDRVDRVVSSPAARACRTAEPIARACDAPLEIAPDLREIDFGELDGRTFGWIEREHPALFAAWMRTPTAVAFPGGESWPSFRRRVVDTLDRIAADGEGRGTVVVAHLGGMLVTLGRALAIADDELFAHPVEHAEPQTFEVRDGSWILVEPAGPGAGGR